MENEEIFLPIKEESLHTNIQKKKLYHIPVKIKFVLSHLFALLWTVTSIILSIPWVKDLSEIVTLPLSLLIITGIAYIPGYINAFLVISLILDRQPPFKYENPLKDITILIAARNEAKNIKNTLSYIAKQDYNGHIKVFVIDNGSSDDTSFVALSSGKNLKLDITVIREENPGKFNALNTALKYVTTDLVITLDADTLLHSSAVRYLIARIESSQKNICSFNSESKCGEYGNQCCNNPGSIG